MNPRLRAVAKTVVSTVNTPIAKSRLTRALGDLPRPIKLEIGGIEQRPGWLVTNVGPLAKHFLDATAPWPLEDESVELVFADNMIEHVPLAAGRAMLAEAFRCMRPGGVIRLVTPDLRKHIDEYLRGAPALDTPLAAAYRGMGLTVDHPVDLVRIPIASFDHHLGFVYDKETLTAELERAGFVDVVEHEMGKSDLADLTDIDSRTDEGPAQMALQAVKPA